MMLIHSGHEKTGVSEQIFPLDGQVISAVTESSFEYTPEQLDFISGSNLTLLSQKDPVLYLLEMKGRPEIATFATPAAQKAYRAGVCVGATIMRDRLELLDANSLAAPDELFDPNSPVLLTPLHPKRLVIPPSEQEGSQGIFSRFTSGRDFFPFLDSASSVEFFDRLKYEWMRGEHEFLGHEERELGSDDYMLTGILDTFVTYAGIYGYEVSSKRSRAKTLGGAIIARLIRVTRESTKSIGSVLSSEESPIMRPTELHQESPETAD